MLTNFYRARKLQKQNEKLQLQLTEARSSSRDLRNQLADAEEFKVIELEELLKCHVACYISAK